MVGEKVAGHNTIEQKLGEGGVGVVSVSEQVPAVGASNQLGEIGAAGEGLDHRDVDLAGDALPCPPQSGRSA